jgi:hypothetical protein
MRKARRFDLLSVMPGAGTEYEKTGVRMQKKNNKMVILAPDF